MTKRFGFTLAEVLITLGIIGVVAAMTMPTLMNSTNGAQYKTAYKKALSVLSQAVVMNVALDDYDLSQTVPTSTNQRIYDLFKNRMNVVNTTGAATSWKVMSTAAGIAAQREFGTATNYTLFFNDGITFTFPKTPTITCSKGGNGVAELTDAQLITGGCAGMIDVNGEKSPNKIVVCDTGTTGDACVVSNPTDMYPVVFYDQSILPATSATKAVLYGK